MKLPFIAVLFLILGTLSGIVGAWLFTLNTVVPWLHLALEWQNLSGLLLFIFFFLEAGAIVGLIGSAAVVGVVALGLYILGSAGEKLKKKAAVEPPQE